MNRSTNNPSSVLEELIEKHRRYPKGKFPYYDDRLMGRLKNSPIDYDKEVYVGSTVFLSLDKISDLEYLTRQYEEKIESLEYKLKEIEKAKKDTKAQLDLINFKLE